MPRYIDADALPRHGRRGGLINWKDIENAPKVDAVKHGHWIAVNSDEEEYKCSECGDKEYYTCNYCPNCGAKMDEEEE